MFSVGASYVSQEILFVNFTRITYQLFKIEPKTRMITDNDNKFHDFKNTPPYWLKATKNKNV